MSDPILSIVSGTYRRLPLLQKMVESVRADVGDLTYEIVIVDAGSDDGTEAWCLAQPDIVLIQQGKKLGPIAAFNAGFRAARGQYCVTMNDDAALVPGTLNIAYLYLESHPRTGQVAFKNITPAGSIRGPYDHTYGGRVYGQCCMTPKWLGDLSGWWGTVLDQSRKDHLGYFFYAGDTSCGSRIWEMGYEIAKVEGCAVIDSVYEDDLRRENNTGWVRVHDNKLYHKLWKDRLPTQSEWEPAPTRGQHVHWRATRGKLRTMRLKLVSMGAPARTGMITAFSRYGPTEQINQSEMIKSHGVDGFQVYLEQRVNDFKPDLLVLQEQGGIGIQPDTLRRIKKQHPELFVVSFNGDIRIPIPERCVEIVALCDLGFVASPDLMECYGQCGVADIAYLPIAAEKPFYDAVRSKQPKSDVVFLGSNYSGAPFPDKLLRRDAVVRLRDAGVKIEVYGAGWEPYGFSVKRTDEKHEVNASIYANSKLALSISHYNDLAYYSSDRLYLAAATGCPVLLKRFPGCEEHGFRDGDTCILFDTLDELVEKTQYYLNPVNNAEREEIGKRGRIETITHHSWDQRVADLLDMVRVRGPVGLSGSAEYIAMRGLKGYGMSPGCSSCGGGSRSSSNGASAKSSNRSQVSLAPRGLAGASGMSTLVYVGGSEQKFSRRGPVSGARYTVRRNHPFTVDVRDLRTGKQDESKQGFLEIRERGVYVYQEFGKAPVITEAEANAANPPGPGLTQVIVGDNESDVREVGVGVSEIQLAIDAHDDAVAESTTTDPVVHPVEMNTVDIESIVNATKAATELAASLNIDIDKVTGTGKNGRITVGDVAEYAESVIS